MSNFNYKAGSVIEYRCFGGDLRRVVVEYRDDDIKNGCPGFVGMPTKGPSTINGVTAGVWGYDSQIVAVVSE